MFGQMGECLLVSGWTIICMAMGFIPGKMVESMKDSMLMTRRTDLESILGLMEGNMLEIGKTESNTVRGCICPRKELKERAYGMKGKGLNG